MPFAKFTSHFDYVTKSRAMVSYPAGYEGDVPQAHFDRAKEAGKLDEGATKPAKTDTGGDGKPK